MTVTASDSGYVGPSHELMEFIGLAQQGPSYGDLTMEQNDELRGRLLEATDFTDLSDADQQFLTVCVREVRAGLSWTLQNYVGGDWAAEDAELGSFDDEPAEQKALDTDDDGWVGV